MREGERERERKKGKPKDGKSIRRSLRPRVRKAHAPISRIYKSFFSCRRYFPFPPTRMSERGFFSKDKEQYPPMYRGRAGNSILVFLPPSLFFSWRSRCGKPRVFLLFLFPASSSGRRGGRIGEGEWRDVLTLFTFSPTAKFENASGNRKTKKEGGIGQRSGGRKRTDISGTETQLISIFVWGKTLPEQKLPSCG